MDEESQRDENIEDYDDEEGGDFRPYSPRIDWSFLLLSTIILQAGAIGALRSNLYMIAGASILAGACASFVTWKEKIEGVTYTPRPDRYSLFFRFLFVVGIALSVVTAARTIG